MVQPQILVIPPTKEFSYIAGDREIKYRMSREKAAEGGKPKIYVTRWEAADLLKEQGYRLPRLQETWRAVLQDHEIRESVLSFPAEWQSELILTPNTQPETGKWVLKDADRRETVLSVSRTARVLVPTEEYFDGPRRIVVANVFDIPDCKSEEKRYDPANPEIWDLETGFFKFSALDPEGQYIAFFPTGEYLHAAIFDWYGHVLCVWEPSDSHDNVGFRGVANSQSEPVKLEKRKLDLYDDGSDHKKPKNPEGFRQPAKKPNPLIHLD